MHAPTCKWCVEKSRDRTALNARTSAKIAEAAEKLEQSKRAREIEGEAGRAGCSHLLYHRKEGGERLVDKDRGSADDIQPFSALTSLAETLLTLPR